MLFGMTNKISGDIKMLKELVKLANHLDSIGHRDLSDDLDSVIRKMAQATTGQTMSGALSEFEYGKSLLTPSREAAVKKTKEILANIENSVYGDQVTQLFRGSPTGRKLSGAAPDFEQAPALRWQLETIIKSLGEANLPFEKELLEEDKDELKAYIERAETEKKSVMLAEQAMAQETDSESDTMAARGDMPDESEGVIRNNEDIMAIESIIGAQATGQFPFNKGTYFALKAFLEANADKLSHSEHSPEDYVQTILDTGPEGFSVRGGEHARITGRSFRDWRNLIEDLQMTTRRGVAQTAQMVTASHDGDYMSEFHARSIENSAEEIVGDLERGKKLDPWQKSYLAQADQMTDSVEERLDQEAKIEAMTKALDKLFKY